MVRRINHVGSNVRSLLGDDGEFPHTLYVRPERGCCAVISAGISFGLALNSQMLISMSAWPSITVMSHAIIACAELQTTNYRTSCLQPCCGVHA